MSANFSRPLVHVSAPRAEEDESASKETSATKEEGPVEHGEMLSRTNRWNGAVISNVVDDSRHGAERVRYNISSTKAYFSRFDRDFRRLPENEKQRIRLEAQRRVENLFPGPIPCITTNSEDLTVVRSEYANASHSRRLRLHEAAFDHEHGKIAEVFQKLGDKDIQVARVRARRNGLLNPEKRANDAEAELAREGEAAEKRAEFARVKAKAATDKVERPAQEKKTTGCVSRRRENSAKTSLKTPVSKKRETPAKTSPKTPASKKRKTTSKTSTSSDTASTQGALPKATSDMENDDSDGKSGSVSFHVGDRVEARWKGQSWYSARVKACDLDRRTAHLLYLDGDEDKHVLFGHIRMPLPKYKSVRLRLTCPSARMKLEKSHSADVESTDSVRPMVRHVQICTNFGSYVVSTGRINEPNASGSKLMPRKPKKRDTNLRRQLEFRKRKTDTSTMQWRVEMSDDFESKEEEARFELFERDVRTTIYTRFMVLALDRDPNAVMTNKQWHALYIDAGGTMKTAAAVVKKFTDTKGDTVTNRCFFQKVPFLVCAGKGHSNGQRGRKYIMYRIEQTFRSTWSNATYQERSALVEAVREAIVSDSTDDAFDCPYSPDAASAQILPIPSGIDDEEAIFRYDQHKFVDEREILEDDGKTWKTARIYTPKSDSAQRCDDGPVSIVLDFDGSEIEGIGRGYYMTSNGMLFDGDGCPIESRKVTNK
eukprot:g180.t1